MAEAYLQLAINTFLSFLLIPLTQPYIEKVMLSAILPYNHIIMAFIVFIFTMLAMITNMLIGFFVRMFANNYISQIGLKNMERSYSFFYKYCLWFCPLLSFISPLLIIIFATLCGFLKLSKGRILLAISFECLSELQKYFF